MFETRATSGVQTTRIGDALVFFADATVTPTARTAADAVASAVEVVARTLGRPIPVLFGEQQHTARSFVYGQEAPLPPTAHLVGRCDALITDEPLVALAVVTADCLPIALVAPQLVAMVHAGWRGLAADILGATVRRVTNEFGIPPHALSAVIGVGVGPCHYRVGDEVRAALAAVPVTGDEWAAGAAVDLQRWAVARLAALSLPRGQIRCLSGCTACTSTYHSFRRDGVAAGRQWSAVVRTGPRAVHAP